MFESLTKDIFYMIIQDFDTRELHRLLSVSMFFNKTINSDKFWQSRIRLSAAALMKVYPELTKLDAELAGSALLGLTKYVEKYIHRYANLNVEMYYNGHIDVYINPIHLAAYSGNLACVKLLISYNSKYLKNYFNSPIHFAAASGSVSCVQYFLDFGVPVDQTSNAPSLGWFWTPLQIASFHNHVQCSKLLLDRGADIHYKDPGNFQAIHRACESGSFECLKLLILAGADVNAHSEDGITPLH